MRSAAGNSENVRIRSRRDIVKFLQLVLAQRAGVRADSGRYSAALAAALNRLAELSSLRTAQALNAKKIGSCDPRVMSTYFLQ